MASYWLNDPQLVSRGASVCCVARSRGFYAHGELAKVQANQREQPAVEQLGEIAPIFWPNA